MLNCKIDTIAAILTSIVLILFFLLKVILLFAYY